MPYRCILYTSGFFIYSVSLTMACTTLDADCAGSFDFVNNSNVTSMNRIYWAKGGTSDFLLPPHQTHSVQVRGGDMWCTAAFTGGRLPDNCPRSYFTNVQP